jgi:hypothetical protein
MCDYSLHGIPNRLAVEGEQLVTFKFLTGSVGLATPTDIASADRLNPRWRSWRFALKHWFKPQEGLDQVPAVCVPPGAHLLINHIPEVLRRKFSLQGVEEVTFVQFSADAYRYRDGIRFQNGKQILLQEIAEGVCFEVLSLVRSHDGAEADRQRAPGPVLVCQ